MFSAYFVFHYLNMFCAEKHVLEFFVTYLATRPVAKPQSRVHLEALATHSRLARDSLATRENFRDCTSRLTQLWNAQK